MAKIQTGDEIKILLGKDNGKTGKVVRVLAKEGKVWVDGLNFYKRHVRKTGETEGGIIDIAKPMNLSNVSLICPNCKKATRVGYKIENGLKNRICKKCGEVIKKEEKKK